MNINLNGCGIDVSYKQQIPAIHIYRKPSGLYSLTDQFGIESLDFVYSQGLINATKYYKVLLDEWFKLIKIGGNIVIKAKSNHILDLKKLKDEVTLLFKEKAEIVDEQSEGANFSLIIKKKATLIYPEDNIDHWSFGIITNGKRNDFVEQSIISIRNQQIPEYEIIVCGTYYNRNEKDFRYFTFSEQDDKGWITRKKNIICQNAKYQNIMVLHDRIVLNNEWFLGMKKYGNLFDSLSCIQTTKEGIRVGDWCSSGGPVGTLWKVGLLDYTDYDDFLYVTAGPIIIKKRIWERCQWDEHLFWSHPNIPLSKWVAEDIELCHRLTKNGYILRLNPYASCTSLSWRWGRLPTYKRNNHKLGRFYGPPYFRRFVWTIFRGLTRLGIIDQALLVFSKLFNFQKISR